MSRFTDRVALVTGGGTGIGRAVTEALVTEGARVVVTGRREEPLKQLAAEHPDAVRYVITDVTEKGAAANAIRFAGEQFNRLDVLINNAGVGTLGPLADLDDETLKQAYGVNVQGVLIATREVIPLKKTVRPSEHDRPDVAAARVAWHAAAPTWDVAHLVCLDETGITTNLLRRYGAGHRAARASTTTPPAGAGTPARCSPRCGSRG